MSESKHTAGPWHQDGHNLSSVIRCTVPRGHPDAKHTCGDYETIARCEGDNWSANARLIASVPDLLAALHGIVAELPTYNADHHSDLASAHRAALRAIAKAEGR